MDSSVKGNFKWRYLLGVWLIYFAFGVMMVSMAPLVSVITNDLKISSTKMGSILGAWPLVYIFMAIPCGAFIDRFGLKKSLFLAALIMSFSGLFRSISHDHISMFLSVAIFGIGGPLISIGAPKLISNYFVNKNRGLAMGIYITGPALGSIIALTTTNSLFMPIFENNWRSVILFFSFFVFLTSLIWLYLSKTMIFENSKKSKFSLFAQLIIYLDLIKIRNVQILLVMSVGIFFYSHGLSNWLPEILRLKNMTLTQAGYWAALPTVAGIIGSLTIPRLANRKRRIFIFALLVFFAMAATILLIFDTNPILSIGLIFQGLSRGTLMTIAILILMESPGVPAKYMGAAGGLFFTFAEVGGVLGPFIMGIIYDKTEDFMLGLNLMTIIIFILMLLLVYLSHINKNISKNMN